MARTLDKALSHTENRRLGWITQVTSFGDFVSLFVVLKWLSEGGVAALESGYAVVVNSIGVAVGAALIPTVLSVWSSQRVIFLSQLLSGLCSLGILAFVARPSAHVGTSGVLVLFSLLFLQTLLMQLFTGARETHSKHLSALEDHLSAQALLLSSFYGAQFLGPLLGFVLARWLPPAVALGIDTASFFGAAALATRLQGQGFRGTASHVLRPLRYLFRQPALRDIVLLRSVAFWFSIGLFNYLLFSVVTDHYRLSVIDSAFVYSAMGLGAALSSSYLRARGLPRWRGLNEGTVACGAQLLFAATVLVFFRLPSFGIALATLVVMGLAMGANTVVTQTLRRKLTTSAQFPEVVGFELVLGRATDVALTSVAAATLLAGRMTYPEWLAVSALAFVVSAALHLRFARLCKHDASPL